MPTYTLGSTIAGARVEVGGVLETFTTGPVSARFRRAVQHSHAAVGRIDITRGSQTFSFRAVDGVVTYDFDDTTRRSLDCTFIDEDGRTYTEMEQLTDPFISELRPYRGVAFSSTDIEWVGLGVYYTDNLEIMEDDGGAVLWRIAALDSSSMCRVPLQFPVFIQSGTRVGDAIPQLLRQSWPRMTYQMAPTAWTVPATLIDEDKVPWDEAVALANAAGMDLYVTRDNLCVMGSRPTTVDPNPRWQFTEGINATFWSPKRSVRTRLPNYIIALGTNTLAPGVRGEAYDNDPYSPTYINGPYGRVVETYRSELLMSNDQAAAMANNILARRLGPSDEVDFLTTPIPFLNEADTIAITRARMGMNQRPLLVSHMEIPLVADDGMRITGRRTVKSEGRAA